jgi:predicted PurR-regulated permease PerM
MNIFDSRAARVLMTALVFALCLGFIWIARRTFIAFLFAIFFAYLLEAPVEYFERKFKRHARGKAISIVYLIIFGTLTALGIIFGSHIFQEGQRLAQQLPDLSEKLSNGQIIHILGSRRGWSANTEQYVQEFFNHHRGQIVGTVENYVNHALASIQNMWWLLLVPILAIFLLKDGARFGHDIIQFFERPNYKRVMAILVTELNQMLGHFMRAQLTLTVLAMAVVTLGLVIMRVPYGYALGPIAGGLEFIPVIGPVIGGAIVLVVAFAANYSHPIFILIFLLIWRGIQDYFTAPRIMGGKLELHPLAVLFGILAGAEVAGVIGVFLSIPVLASIKIAWRTYRQAKRTSDLDEHQPSEPLASTTR